MKASIMDGLYNKKIVDKKIQIFPGHQMLNKEVLRNGVEACHTTSSWQQLAPLQNHRITFFLTVSMLSNSGNTLTSSSRGSSFLCNAKTKRNGCLAQRIIGLPSIEKRKSKQKQIKTLPSHPENSITFEHQRDAIKESMYKE